MLQKILLSAMLVLIGQGIMAAENTTDCESIDDIVKMSSCAEAAYFASKKEIEGKIKDIKAQKDVSNRAKRLLDKANKSWQQYRWNYCTFATEFMEGKPGHSFHKFDCLGRVTKQQLENLQEYIEGLDV